MKRTLPAFCLALGSCLCAKAQLYIDNATFYIETGATVTVQGDITSNASIQGPGKILLKGSTLQNVNMTSNSAMANTIPNLEIDNTANAMLTGNTRIGTSLLFTNGKILTGDFNFILANAATVSGTGTSKFVETTGLGYVQKEVSGTGTGVSGTILPTGVGSNYTPVTLTHSGGTYGTGAVVSAQAKSGKSPNAHIRTESYVNVYWPLATTGVTGGTFSATGTYGTAGVTNTESDVRGISYNGTVWSLTGSNQDYTNKTVTAQLASNSGQLFGMNRFLLLNSRVILQGAYSGTGGIMTDNLRNNVGGTNVIPTTEPYQAAPYNTAFSSTNGGTREMINATVLNDLGTNDNIVDWVFVELRNNVASGSVVQQTRSLLLQKDGDIVDIDGVSPIYFKNLDAGNFTITVRHRNHLAISTNNTGSYFPSLNLAPSLVDFTTLTDGNVLGTSGTNYGVTTGGLKMMYAGNANGVLNGAIQRTSYSGSGNDAAYILNTLLGGNGNSSLSPVYSQGDVNMNKRVSYSGSGNDAAFILNMPLGGNGNASKTEVKPL